MSEGDVSQPRRSLPDSRWTAMPHPRIASPHGCNYRLIPVPINPGGWSSRQTPSPRPIRRLCRSHSLMFETDRTHTKCMCDLSEEKMFPQISLFFRPREGLKYFAVQKSQGLPLRTFGPLILLLIILLLFPPFAYLYT